MELLSQDGSEVDEVGIGEDALGSLAEDEVIDFITGNPVKLKGNEEVRQRIARALYREYRISVEDMERGFPIEVTGVGRRRTTKKTDIAVFASGTEHAMANLRRVVICKPEPKNGRTGTKIRTYGQAQKDLEELEALLGTESTPQVQYGMWTNGLDIFFLYKESARFGAENVFYMDSLAFPGGDLPGVADAIERIPLNSVDVLMTNPPFGTDIKIEDSVILDMYRDGVARSWSGFGRRPGFKCPGNETQGHECACSKPRPAVRPDQADRVVRPRYPA